MEGVDHLKAHKNYWFSKVFQESSVLSNEQKRNPGQMARPAHGYI